MTEEAQTIEFHSTQGNKPVRTTAHGENKSQIMQAGVLKVEIDCDEGGLVNEANKILDGNYNENAVYYDGAGVEVDVKIHEGRILWKHLWEFPIGTLFVFLDHTVMVNGYSNKDLVCLYYGGGEYKTVTISHDVIVSNLGAFKELAK